MTVLSTKFIGQEICDKLFPFEQVDAGRAHPGCFSAGTVLGFAGLLGEEKTIKTKIKSGFPVAAGLHFSVIVKECK